MVQLVRLGSAIACRDVQRFSREVAIDDSSILLSSSHALQAIHTWPYLGPVQWAAPLSVLPSLALA